MDGDASWKISVLDKYCKGKKLTDATDGKFLT